MIANATRSTASIVSIATALACSSNSPSGGGRAVSSNSGGGDASGAVGTYGGGGGGPTGSGGAGEASSTSGRGGSSGGMRDGGGGVETVPPPNDGGLEGDASSVGDDGGDTMVGTGQFDCTMNAGEPMHHVGAEHKGHALYGVVVDTTTGANLARVGWVQKTVVQADLFVKFVWPKILVTGHTYEIAVFDDMTNSKTCTATDRTWIFPVPIVTGSYVANWVTGNQPFTTGTCRDFPTSALP